MNNSKDAGRVKELHVIREIREIEAPPRSPMSAYPMSPAKATNPSLKEAWEVAKLQFSKKTGRPLSVSSGADLEKALTDVTTKFQAKEDKGGLQKKKLKQVGKNIIAGIQAVGGIAAEGASIAFPPAGLCFSALSFLLAIPDRISAVFNTVSELFEEVEDFLVRFKIFNRIDARRQLDSDIVYAAGIMLISFIEICALSIDMVEHSRWTSFKAAIISDDSGAGGMLVGFRRRALDLDRLTTSLSYEHIIGIKEISKETGADVKKLLMSDNMQKTEIVNSKRLKTIEDNIYGRDERNLATKSAQSPDYDEALIQGTLDALITHAEYHEWMSPMETYGRKALLLSGERGTGKSRMLHAFKEHLDDTIRWKAPTDVNTVYVALYIFEDRRTEAISNIQVPNPSSSQIPAALRSMAVQVARQSTRYASALEDCLVKEKDKDKSISKLSDVENLWQKLRLSTFNAPDGATLYLLFDGLEHVGDKAKSNSAVALFKMLSNKKTPKDTLQIRSIFTVDGKFSNTRHVPMGEIARNLSLIYAKTELKRYDLFQSADAKSQARHKEVMDAVKGASSEDDKPSRAWSFTDVKGKLQQINAACQSGAQSHELTRILSDEYISTMNLELNKKLQKLANSLSPDQTKQLQQIIPWTMYYCSPTPMKYSELDAVLSLADCGDSLQNFEQQVMGNHFGDLFLRFGEYAWLQDDYDDVLREGEIDPTQDSKEKTPLISLNLSIQNAEETVIRQFVSNLNDQMNTGRFELFERPNATTQTISVNKLEAHLTITRLCLKLLNEGWQENGTDVLVDYAREYLPRHFVELDKSIDEISEEQQATISQNLVSFLSDPYYLSQDPDRHFGTGEYWLQDSESRESVRSWLAKTRDRLLAREKRWVDNALKSSDGELGFMKTIALAVGHKWATHIRENAKERENPTDNREAYCVTGSLSLESMLFKWLVSFVEVHTAVSTTTPNGESSADEQDNPALGEDRSPDNENPPELDLKPEEPVAPSPSEDGVENVLRWLRKNATEKIDESCDCFRINIGYTYLWLLQLDKAEEYFTDVKNDTPNQRQAIAGLGRLYNRRGRQAKDNQQTDKSRKHRAEAVELLVEAINAFEPPNPEQALHQDEKVIHGELIHEAAMIYEELDNKNKAIEYYRQSVECTDDFVVRWEALKYLCKQNPADCAIQLLKKWAGKAEGSLAHTIYLSATEDAFCVQLERLIDVIRDENLRAMLLCALTDAVDIAKKEPQSRAAPGLLYLVGLAYARSSDAEQRKIAAEHWKDVLDIVPLDEPDWGFGLIMGLAARGVALFEFETWRATVTSTSAPQLPTVKRHELMQQLKTNLDTPALYNSSVRERIDPIVHRYIISGWSLLGHIDNARQVAKGEMAIALSILLDEDPDNDLEGIRYLLEIFCALGDKVGALTAFSLLDRQTPTPEADLRKERLDALYRGCDGCAKSIQSYDADGFWVCQFCNDFDLCSNCHRELVDGRLNLHLCRPNHNFIHLYHTKYAPGEVASGKVRVGWTWEETGEGYFTRKDGQIDNVSDWCKSLRAIWNIEESDKTSVKAQK